VICAQLPNAETVDVKAGDSLPSAMEKLVSLFPQRSSFASVDIKQCPACGTAYRHERIHTHDNFLDPNVEESLERLTPAEARELLPPTQSAELAARAEGLYRQLELLLAAGTGPGLTAKATPVLRGYAERALADVDAAKVSG
jgi:hypothetical protein